MNRLESTKKINKLKAFAIKNGGYSKFETVIKKACNSHLVSFGIDLTPPFL